MKNIRARTRRLGDREQTIEGERRRIGCFRHDGKEWGSDVWDSGTSAMGEVSGEQLDL